MPYGMYLAQFLKCGRSILEHRWCNMRRQRIRYGDSARQCSSSIPGDAGQRNARKSTHINQGHPRHGSSRHRRRDQVPRGLIPLPLLPKEQAHMFQRLGIPKPYLIRKGGAQAQSSSFRNLRWNRDGSESEGRRELGTFQAFACPRRRARRWPCGPGPPSLALAGGLIRGWIGGRSGHEAAVRLGWGRRGAGYAPSLVGTESRMDSWT